MTQFRNHDAFITGWSGALQRYRQLGERPRVLFVCEDEGQARAFARAADGQVTGRIAEFRTPEHEWVFPGRERMLVACERDAHEGSLRAWRLPALPPDVRGRLGLAREPEPEQVELTDSAGAVGRADLRP